MVVSTNITISPFSCASGVPLHHYGLSKRCRQSLYANRLNYGALVFSAKTAIKNLNKHMLTIVTNCEILYSATPLDKEQPDWRIRQPQVVTQIGQLEPFSPIRALVAGIFRSKRCIRGHGSGAKENAPAVPSYLGHCLAATRSALSKQTDRALTMLYTFIIAYPCAKKAQLQQLRRVRTISAIANTEQEARAQLSGLPLVFVRQTTTPAKTRLLTPLWGNPVPGSGHPMLQGGAA